MRIITYIILSCFIAACSQSRSGGELEQALKLSGENRNALEAVLGHYKHDSLKYRASCFPYQEYALSLFAGRLLFIAGRGKIQA